MTAPSTSPQAARRAWLPGAALFVVLGLAAVLYWPGLSGWLLLDDFVNLQPLQAMERGNVSWLQAVLHNESGPLGRPLAMLSFAANWLTSSGAVWNLKYTNLMLHLLCGTLVFWLGGRLLAEADGELRRARWWLALWAAAAWLAAPLLVSTVLYVVQRMAQLAALFVLAGLLAYVIGRQNLARRFVFGCALIAAAFLVCWPLAVLGKENGALLPLLALVVEAFFFRFEGGQRTRRLLLAVFGVTVGLPALAALGRTLLDPGWITGGYAARDFTFYQRVLTEPRALLDYVLNLFVPHGPGMGVFHDDYPASSGLLAPPQTLLALLLWAAVLVAAWRLRGPRARVLLFGPVFFLAGHALESSVFPLELYFEHRNYLPAAGIFLSAGAAVWSLREVFSYRRLLAAFLVVLPLGYGAASYQRVMLWRSPLEMLHAQAVTHPGSPRVNVELASNYMAQGDAENALIYLDRAAALSPRELASGIAMHRLVVYCSSHRPVPESAYARLEQAARVQNESYTVNSLALLTERYLGGACPALDVQRVVATLERWLGARADNADLVAWNLHFYAGRLLGTTGHRERAVEHLRAASRISPELLAPGLLAFRYQMELGRTGAARRTLARLRAHDVHNVASHTRALQAYEALLREVDASSATSAVPDAAAVEQRR